VGEGKENVKEEKEKVKVGNREKDLIIEMKFSKMIFIVYGHSSTRLAKTVSRVLRILFP
jgi:NurA-like 5'-3' nuclease